MIISNSEKQILQKHYAEKIKSLAANLKDTIQNDRQDLLGNAITAIEGAGERIRQIQNDWLSDERKLEVSA